MRILVNPNVFLRTPRDAKPDLPLRCASCRGYRMMLGKLGNYTHWRGCNLFFARRNMRSCGGFMNQPLRLRGTEIYNVAMRNSLIQLTGIWRCLLFPSSGQFPLQPLADGGSSGPGRWWWRSWWPRRWKVCIKLYLHIIVNYAGISLHEMTWKGAPFQTAVEN